LFTVSDPAAVADVKLIGKPAPPAPTTTEYEMPGTTAISFKYAKPPPAPPDPKKLPPPPPAPTATTLTLVTPGGAVNKYEPGVVYSIWPDIEIILVTVGIVNVECGLASTGII
jgi:hypothetical protein